MKKKAFISWSNVDPRIGPLAIFFKDWITNVFNNRIEFFFSKEIRAGRDWRDEIDSALKTSEFGLFFLSQRTVRSPWVMFEFGNMHGTAKKGDLLPILFDMNASELSVVCPPIAHIQAISLLDEEAFYALVAELADRVAENQGQSLQIRGSARREYPLLQSYVSRISNMFSVMPNKFAGTITFNHNIQQSDNFQMPEIFAEAKEDMFFVGINLGFLLNLNDSPDRFVALIKALIEAPKKRCDILISNIWDSNIRDVYQKNELGRVSKELAGFDRVFSKKNDKLYIDNFIRKCCDELGGDYEGISKQLKIKSIDMLIDTFWFVDVNPATQAGNMMMIPMTGSEGSTRPVFYINIRENSHLFNYYYRLCRGGFDTLAQNLWPEP